jgi:ankyrin repeat protein
MIKMFKTSSQPHHTQFFGSLHMAVVEKNLDKVKAVCNKDNINDTAGEEYFTALHCAALDNVDEPIIKFLLDTPGCDINKKTTKGKAALFMAALAGHESVVKLLLSRGATADPAYFKACSNNINNEYPEIFKALQAALPEEDISSDTSSRINQSQNSSSYSWGNNWGSIVSSFISIPGLTRRTPAQDQKDKGMAEFKN